MTNGNGEEQKVLIGMPCASGLIPSATVTALLELNRPLPCSFVTADRWAIAVARNWFADQTIGRGYDYLFMVDDDNPIPSDTLKLFLEDDKDIVLAPIVARTAGKDGKHRLCAFYRLEYSKELENGELVPHYGNITEFKDEGPLHRIGAGGTGCILIKRKVLVELDKKYPRIFEFTTDIAEKYRRVTSEDIQFCERATDMGFEVWLDDRIRPVHLGAQEKLVWEP
jgi:hypothetical protein